MAYVEGNTRLHREPVFDVYAPEEEGPGPVALIASGIGLGKGCAHDWATAMASQGVVVFAVEYEIGAPQTPLPHLNCAARDVRDVADDCGGDPSHVTPLGYSLGANFGAPVQLGVDELPPRCLASDDAAIPDAFVGYEGWSLGWTPPPGGRLDGQLAHEWAQEAEKASPGRGHLVVGAGQVHTRRLIAGKLTR